MIEATRIFVFTGSCKSDTIPERTGSIMYVPKDLVWTGYSKIPFINIIILVAIHWLLLLMTYISWSVYSFENMKCPLQSLQAISLIVISEHLSGFLIYHGIKISSVLLSYSQYLQQHVESTVNVHSCWSTQTSSANWLLQKNRTKCMHSCVVRDWWPAKFCLLLPLTFNTHSKHSQLVI